MELKYKFFTKWSFLKITNAYELIRPCLFLYKCYGLFPYRINKNSIVLCKLGCCHTVFMAIICTIYPIVFLYQCHISKSLEYSTVEGLLQVNCYFILATFITVSTYISTRSKISLLRKIFEVSSILSENDFRQLAKIIYVKNSVGFIFLMGQSFNIYAKPLALLLFKAFGLYVTVVVFLMDFQYSNYILILKSCFKNINNNLLRLKENYVGREIDIYKNTSNRSQFNNLQAIKLRKLQQKYHQISYVVKELNSAYTLQIIATILMTFAEVTFSLYFFLLHSQGMKNIDLDKQIWYHYFATSITYYALKMIIMVSICQEAKNESLKTGIIVHDVILYSNNDYLKAEV